MSKAKNPIITRLTFAIICLIAIIHLHSNAHAETRQTIFVGDSRTVQMHGTLTGQWQDDINQTDSTGTWICKGSTGYEWFADIAMPKAIQYMNEGNKDLVILMGCNDMINPSSANTYLNYLYDYNNILTQNNNHVYFVSVNPVGHNGNSDTTYESLSNTGTCEPFNNYIRNGLPENMTYVDTYSTLLDIGYATTDGCHFDNTTYQNIYTLILNAIALNQPSIIIENVDNPIQLQTDTPETTAQTDANDDGIIIEGENVIAKENQYFTVTFDVNGGKGETDPREVRYNQPIGRFPTPTKEGYQVDHWETPDGIVVNDTTKVTSDLTAIAQWVAIPNTVYTVIRKVENFDGTFEKYDTYTDTGATDVTTKVIPKELPGFTAPKPKNLKIKSDGSSTIEFEYTRNTYSIKLNIGEGVISKQKKFEYKFDAPVNLNIETKEYYDSFTIEGEETSTKFNMPPQDIELTISAKPTTYHIRYKGQGISTEGLPKTYTIDTLPVKLKTPIVSSVWKFQEWTYDGKPITEITDASHTDMILVAKVTIQETYILLGIFILLALIICILLIKSRNKKRRKNKKTNMN